MSLDNLRSGIRFIVETMPSAGGLSDDIETMTEGLCQGVVSAQNGAELGTLKHADPNIFGGGGSVFLWEDVLDIGDIIDTLADFEFPPDKLGLLAYKLLCTWTTLRKVRVSLSENEFRTLRAVKAGKVNPAEIVRYTRLSADEVAQAIKSLREKRYKKDIPLLVGEDHLLSTEF